MPLELPVRLFNVKTMRMDLYKDIQDDVRRSKYVCISHVWGDQQDYSPEQLGVEGDVDWKIPLSDSDKLTRVKKAVLHFKMKYCWIDVLCIPQGDDREDERIKEIPNMGDYYAGAEMTLVMGSNLNNLSNAILGGSGNIAVSLISGLMDMSLSSARRAYRITDLPSNREEWFTRVWTFQEALLSRSLKYVGIDGKYHDLTAILDIVPTGKNAISFTDQEELRILGYAISGRYKGEMDLTEVMSRVCQRKCTKPQDMIYGALAILKYPKYPVDYKISMERLNYNIIRHAHSKGDISWLSVGKTARKGLIPAMCEEFVHVGKCWKAMDSKTVVEFKNDTVFVNACYLADVECCERYTGRGGFMSWMLETFKRWNISNYKISYIISGYRITKDDEILMRDRLDDMLENTDEFDPPKIDGNYGINAAIQHTNYLRDVDRLSNTTTIVVARNENERFPLLVIGDANVGDKIMLAQVRDYYGRTLGIVTNGRERSGVCLYKIEDCERVYEPYEYML